MSNPEKPVLKSHRRPDVETTVVAVGDVRFGDGSYPVVAGPIAVETEEQVINTAMSLAESGASMLRAGTYRAENSPYSFRGLGQEGLWHLEKAGFESLSAAGDRLLLLDKKGMLVVAAADSSGYRELARVQALPADGAKFWTAPVIANGHIYCRSSTGDLVAIKVK